MGATVDPTNRPPKEGKDKVTALKGFWQTYEIPITLVAVAFAVVIFIYTTFPTGNAVNQRFEAMEDRQGRMKTYVDQQDNLIREDISTGFQELKEALKEDRKVQVQILLELRRAQR